MMQMQWDIIKPDETLVRRIQERLDCHPVTAAVIANRRLDSPDKAADFIEPSMSDLPSPFMLSDMRPAVERICQALEKDEKILVIGDYDADGITATAVITGFLESAGARIRYHLPHRIHEGYGFNRDHVMQLARPQGAGLIITVDCGSASHQAVEAATRFGIDTIITDHHRIDDLMPAAFAVINPQKPGEPEELSLLAGVGVAFYLAIALRMALRDYGWWRERPEPNLKALCDLVAIGTVADVVPLLGVNRILTKIGLQELNYRRRPGIRALLDVSGISRGAVVSEDIAYRIAPRINAAGRISHAKRAMDLLCATDSATAEKLAETLNGLNRRRQSIETLIFDEIVHRMESRPDLLQRRTILAASENWHEGVLGIVAAKLAAQYHRPVVLISTRNGIAKGSGRSIATIDLFEALSRCAHLLERFGGHRSAAGLSLCTEKIHLLRDAFEKAVDASTVEDDMVPRLAIDSMLSFDQITPKLMDELEYLEPYGSENPPPVFRADDVHVQSGMMFKQRHRRMRLAQNSRPTEAIDAVQFNLTPDAPRPNYFQRMAFRLQWNRYRGNKKIQMVVEAC
jgi:single-stranded-DNA-specific exonuclease